MKYLLLTLTALALGAGIAVASPVQAVATSQTTTVLATAEAQPSETGIQKTGYFQRIKTFAKTVISSLISKPSKGLLIVLAILIPWLAVGLATDWDLKHVIINLLLGFCCTKGV